jgi:hypothetical protein
MRAECRKDHFKRRACQAVRTSSSPKIAALAVLSLLSTITVADADEGGVSFWLPGQFGSLAATPAQPGWSAATVYYHTTSNAGAGQTFVRGGSVQAGLDARADLGFFNGTYVFATPVFGAQAAVGLTGAFGRIDASVAATLTGPLGNSISGARSDSFTGFSDLYPTASLKWNQGVHNFMVYTMWDAPVGDYASSRLANTGIGHWASDFGGGYTYFNPLTGHEFSTVVGLTYNGENTSTNYQNGIDAHLDWGASQFLTKQFQVGLVGYYYQQLTGDSGLGAVLGDNKARIAAVGPQVGFLFPLGELQGYLNLKGYYEFAAQNRPEGWNTWLTFAISPAAEPPPAARKPGIYK